MANYCLHSVQLNEAYMKIKFLLLGMFFAIAGFSQSTIKFDVVTHNFGKIKKGVPKTISFTYTNAGSRPAVIEFATAECGCTSPEYNQAPLLNGKKATIKVTYNAEALGVFKKRVSVKFAGEKEVTQLVIEGEVVK
jgi:hypothetical protein